MGSFISPVKKINELYFQEIPAGKAIDVDKFIRIDRDYIILDKSGRLYSNRVGKYCYCVGEWPWFPNVMNGLVKLKVLTKDDVKAHMDRVKEVEEERQLNYDAEDFIKIAKRHGFILTREQEEALKIRK